MQPVSRQRINKYIPAATNTHAAIEEPVSKQRIGKHNNWGCWKRCLLFSPCKVVITKSSVEEN
jgi:hypothetical protein